MNGRRVVVTGLGMVSPVGLNVADSWDSILAGRSGVAAIESFDVSAYTTRFSASVKDFDPTPYIPAKDARKMDVFVQFGMAAGIQAMEDAGLEITEENAPRVGCSIGSRDWRHRPDREEHRAGHSFRAAQDVPLLCARFDYQHDRR